MLHQLHEAELVARNHELTGDRMLAEEELNRKMGTLRYLRQLRLARERAQARVSAATPARAAADAVEAPGAAAGGGGSKGGTSSAAAPAPAPASAPASTGNGSGAGAWALPPAPAAEPCPICHEELGATCAVMPCGHALCCNCAEALVARLAPGLAPAQRRIGCPTCRARHAAGDIAWVDEGGGASLALTTSACAADAIAAAGGAAAAGSHDAGAAAATSGCGGVPRRAPVVPPGGWWASEAAVRVAGSYGSKVEAVVRRILFLLRSDAQARVLLFTQWADLADIIGHALRANGVEPATGRGRQGFVRAVEEFKAAAKAGAADGFCGGAVPAAGGKPSVAGGDEAEATLPLGQQEPQEGTQPLRQGQQHGKDGEEHQHEGQPSLRQGPAALLAQQQLMPETPRPASRVLLLLVSQGGMGLNLTEAAHVVLVEPLLDPALEVQAIGRVHRFGQQQTTHVHRFVVGEWSGRGGRQRLAAGMLRNFSHRHEHSKPG
jgi:hypothetical protein